MLRNNDKNDNAFLSQLYLLTLSLSGAGEGGVDVSVAAASFSSPSASFLRLPFPGVFPGVLAGDLAGVLLTFFPVFLLAILLAVWVASVRAVGVGVAGLVLVAEAVPLTAAVAGVSESLLPLPLLLPSDVDPLLS